MFGQQTKIYSELLEHEELVFPYERGRRKKRTGQTFRHSGISARGLGKRCDAVQFWHDTDADRYASAVEDKDAPRRTQASTSTLGRMVLKFRACGWSEDVWDPALAYILMSSVEATDKRLEVEVPSTVVMDPSAVSASTSVWLLCRPTTSHRHCALRHCR